MNYLKIAILSLAMVVACNASAATKKKNSKKVEPKVEQPKADTVSLKDFSYALGAAQTTGLRDFLVMQGGIDTTKNMTDFLKGLRQAMDNSQDKALNAFTIGLNIGMQVTSQAVKQYNQQITGNADTTYIDVEAFKKGFYEAAADMKLPYSVDSAAAIATRQMQYYAAEKLEREFGQNRKDGQDFLAQNKKLDGVKTTESGLQYKEIKHGAGPLPVHGSTVKVNYKGTLIDGTIFDTTEGKQPFTTNVDHVIKGWTEALLMMPVGSKWEVYIPYDLAYGDRDQGKIKPYSTLIFEIELLEIVEKPKKLPAKK